MFPGHSKRRRMEELQELQVYNYSDNGLSVIFELALRGIICKTLYPQGSFSEEIYPLYRYQRVHYALHCYP